MTCTLLWNMTTKKLITMLTSDNLPRSPISVAFPPDGATIAVGYDNRTVALWTVATGTQTTIPQIPVSHPPGVAVSLTVTSVAFSPDGKTLAIGVVFDSGGVNGRYTGSTYLWSTATGKVIATLTDPGGGMGVTSLMFSHSGTTLAVGDQDDSTYLWNLAAKKVALTLPDPHGSAIGSVAFTPNGRTLAVVDADGAVYLWSTTTKQITATLTCPGNNANWMAVSPNGAALAEGIITEPSTGNDSTTCLWKITYHAS